MNDRANPERWNRLSDLFHRALECEPNRRGVFLDEECHGDASLRDEVESLLAFHEQTNGLIDTPTHLVAAGAGEAQAGSLVGHTVHQYCVTKKLGEGGMGVVYLADDTRLGRQVALKALGASFVKNDERRERLRREARAAAGLSHPGIATVYALEEFEEQLYIVSEYVPGRTLRDEVATGPLPIKALLATAVEIARALAAAHHEGVVHRDLKPENVIRTPEGSVKVLDFGLAYVGSAGDTASTTRLTEPGSVLGTPGYISPEQLRGTNVDFRTDHFSFGVLLYELTSGAHPFTSSNPASTIARVLEAEPPDVTELSAECPPELEQVIRRCLRKEAKQRYASTTELVEALELLRRDIADTSSRSASASATREPSLAKPKLSPLWWWQFHQVAVGLVYYLTLIPMWTVRSSVPGPWGALLFFSTVAIVGVAATLRFHLWFTSRFTRAELAAQRSRVFWITRVADSVFVLLLLSAGAAMADSEVALTALLVGIAVGSFIAFLVIEPATTRAAFKRSKSRSSRPRSKKSAGTRKKSGGARRRG